MNEDFEHLDRPDTMVCDMTTGLCGPAVTDIQPITITYVTDPICSACWAMEPAWRAAEFHYGHLFTVRHVYGGLLPSWEGFADSGNGIHAPTDVEKHWEEMAEHTGQALNPAVWSTDPIASSFPPSVVAVAVRDVDPMAESRFLRALREELFLRGRNITRPEVWADAVRAAGVDEEEVRARLADGRAKDGFGADLGSARALRASVFPTLIVESPDDRTTLRGVQSFDRLEAVISDTAGVPGKRREVSVDEAITHLGAGTGAEYAALLGGDVMATETRLSAAGLTSISLPGGRTWQP